jgi:REP element-mobilizing transposase RayT
LFLETLGEACTKTGWRVLAWCLMSNHFQVLNSPWILYTRISGVRG